MSRYLGCALLVCLAALLRPAPAATQAQTVTLTITHAGSSGGTVGVVPTGRLCTGGSSSPCVVSLTSGDVVTLSANGLAGSGVPGVFSAGTGSAAACAKSTCGFTITENSSVTITFDPSNGPIVTVTVTLDGDGQGEVGVNNSRRQNFDPSQFTAVGTTYVTGSTVSIRGVAAAESRFSGFSAGTDGAVACGTAANCSFTANANATVTATFHALTALTVSPATASIGVARDQTFTPQGTYSNGVTETIGPGLMGTWRTRTNMTTARSALAVAAAAGKIYAIGGLTGTSAPGAPSAVVQAFDPVANTWSSATSMSVVRDGLGAATVSDLIYAIGGNTSGGVAVDAVERYDPAADTWTTRAALPAPRRYLAVAALNGIVYAIGGETSGGTVATVEAYDPVADTWTARASLATARKNHAAAAGNGVLYVMGGVDASGNPLSSLEVYDPIANTWTTKTAMPGSRSGLAAAFADGVLYAVGGQSSGSASGSITSYDPVFNQWYIKSGMPTSRAGLGVAALNGILYAAGGQQTSFPSLQKIEAFTDSYRWQSSNATVATINQQGRAVGAALGQSNIILTLGSLSCFASSGCGVLTVAPTTMSLDRTSLAFGATSNGVQLTNTTPPQPVRMTQTGPGVVTWTATSNQPWLVVSPTSGTGSAIFNISVVSNSSLGVSGNFTGAVSIALTGASTTSVGPVDVALSLQVDGTSAVPFGAMDTPNDGETGVVGSIPVTGWALDDVGVSQVRIVRLGAPGEPAGSEIFLGTANIVEGARPDVATNFPGAPKGTAAGWGYLLLTNFLPNQGNGTFTLRAYADDVDGHTTLLGSKTITCENAAATTPFGAIDTPGQGETVSGDVNNFGWVLSPGTRRADPTSGGVVNVFVDGIPIGQPSGWSSRGDLSSLFPVDQYSGVTNALGVFGFDTTSLSNGVHTIAWGVTDNVGGAAGVGSRYFTVSNGSGVTAANREALGPVPAGLALVTPGLKARPTTPILGRRGYELQAAFRTYAPGDDGVITVQSEEVDRIELHVGRQASGYQRVGGIARPFPIGSHLDAASGVFTWQPGPGFLGAYDFVFEGDGALRNVRVVLNPKGRNPVGPQIVIDRASPDLAGWAVDLDSNDGTGIATIHVWAYPAAGGPPVFVGEAEYGGARPDVGAIYGSRFTRSGYGIRLHGLAPGTYDLAVFGYSTVTGRFGPAKTARVVIGDGGR